MKGLFITIEGIHGVGKTTICQMLIKQLKEFGLDAILVIDQAGTEIGKKIRKVNLEAKNNIDILTEALLIAAARRQNIAEVIIPNLNKGKNIVGERYSDAYFAFQGFAQGLATQFLTNINSTISEGVMPDLTILLDLEPSIALTRLNNNQMHRIEKKPMEFHKKVRQGYLELAKKFPERIKIVDANQPIENVFENVLKIVRPFLVLRGKIKC